MKLSDLIIKNRGLTAVQYYFPYFMEPPEFEKELAEFGIKPMVLIDRENKIESEMHFIRNEQHYVLDYGTRFMIADKELVSWKADTDLLEIQKVSLTEDFSADKPSTFKIVLSDLKAGLNKIKLKTGLKNFITYVRKSDLKYDLSKFDNFMIVLINDNMIRLIPFDWFNTSETASGYVWPATARLDLRSGKLHGNGMRMNKFQIDLQLEPDYS